MKLCVVVFSILVIKACAKVRCYDCLTPRNPTDWTVYCSEKHFCYGEYCTRGPNARSNGILHGCSAAPPLEGVISECKTVESGIYLQNCYCKNNNFCNTTSNANFLFLFASSLLYFILN